MLEKMRISMHFSLISFCIPFLVFGNGIQNLSLDYHEEEHEVIEEIVHNINSSSKEKTPTTNQPILTDIKDIERLARFVLLRGHIILDPTHIVQLNESRVSRLIDYFHDIQLRKGKRRISPMEDRDLGCERMVNKKKNSKELCEAVTSECLSASEMLELLPKSSIDFHQIIARLCPLLLFRHTRPICDADVWKSHHQIENTNMKLVEPSIERVWGFGVLFVTLSIVVSMGGLMVLPFLNKYARRTILTLFEGLAVGGLAGSAILHLFPQAFDIVDDKYRQYFWRTFLIFGGIYMFYCVEMLFKIITTMRSKGKRKRPSLQREEEKDVLSGIPQLAYKQPSTDTSNLQSFEMQRNRSNSLNQREALLNSTREQLAQCLTTVNVVTPVSNAQLIPDSVKGDSTPQMPKENFVAGVALRRQDQNSSPIMNIDTVAWMIVLGDALLNFIDGLSIGAAFDRNILAGISISVAVMLEEVAHRLGTFAVLIRAGMKMKQSFLYIFLSACACYPGLALGIFLGDEAEEASPYIFALAGGFFLYMALVDVMREMNRSMENASRKGVKSMLRIWGLQNIGIVISVISLSLLAFYERDMDFEEIELEEIAEHSLE